MTNLTMHNAIMNMVKTFTDCGFTEGEQLKGFLGSTVFHKEKMTVFVTIMENYGKYKNSSWMVVSIYENFIQVFKHHSDVKYTLTWEGAMQALKARQELLTP
jgi:hypothetical protein